jgi:hypothetical protein
MISCDSPDNKLNKNLNFDFVIDCIKPSGVDCKAVKSLIKGRLAQPVQSTCSTSRGSLVRIQHRPPINIGLLAILLRAYLILVAT